MTELRPEKASEIVSELANVSSPLHRLRDLLPSPLPRKRAQLDDLERKHEAFCLETQWLSLRTGEIPWSGMHPKILPPSPLPRRPRLHWTSHCNEHALAWTQSFGSQERALSCARLHHFHVCLCWYHCSWCSWWRYARGSASVIETVLKSDERLIVLTGLIRTVSVSSTSGQWQQD